MQRLRFAMIGAGFWATPQLNGWRELAGAECVAVCNRTRSKAEALATRFGIGAVYADVEEMIGRERLDFLDIVTDVKTHRRLVELAAAHRLPVICQKPMAETIEDARAMVAVCRAAGVPFLVHENWRWQRPLREVKAVLGSGAIGRVFRGRIDYCNSFPVFESQPFLKELKQFILTDIGSHILDVARFLFGESRQLYCRTQRVHEDIQGEDVATVMMSMGGEAIVTANLSYASRVEHDRFPETFVQIEGTAGSIELSADYWLRVTTADGTTSRRVPPPHYPWADARYALVHSSIVPCHANLLEGLRGGAGAETTGADNLRTMELVFAAYESAATGRVVGWG
jgi:predicted dehydrogenase